MEVQKSQGSEGETPKTFEKLNQEYNMAAFQAGHASIQIKQFEAIYNLAVSQAAMLIEELKKAPKPAPLTEVPSPTPHEAH